MIKPLADLRRQDCRFPVNDPPPKGGFIFCGERRKPCSSYCERHHQVVYKPIPKEKPAHHL